MFKRHTRLNPGEINQWADHIMYLGGGLTYPRDKFILLFVQVANFFHKISKTSNRR